MNNRQVGRRNIAIGLIIVVLVLIVGVFFMTRGGGNKAASNAVPTAQPTTPVVVALYPVSQGTTFQAGENLSTIFGIQNLPPQAVPFGAYTSVQQVQSVLTSASCGPVNVPGCRGIVTASQTIFQGEPVVSGMLSSLGAYRTSAGPAFQIPYGYVAIAVSISSVNSVEGSINPGDDVDMLASYLGPGNSTGLPDGGKKIPTQTQYTLNDLRVIGVGGPPSPPPPPPPAAGQATPTPGAAQPTAVPANTQGGGTLVLLVRYQEALVIQHLKDFAGTWQTSIVLRSSKETDIPHFKTLPVTARWFFSKQTNHFDLTNPY